MYVIAVSLVVCAMLGSQPTSSRGTQSSTRSLTTAGHGRRVELPIEVKLNQGMNVSTYIHQIVQEPVEIERYHAPGHRLPEGFWRVCFRNHLRSQWSKQRQMMHLRNFRQYAESRRKGELVGERITAITGRSD